MLLGNFIIAFQVLIKKVNISHHCDDPGKKKKSGSVWELNKNSVQHTMLGCRGRPNRRNIKG